MKGDLVTRSIARDLLALHKQKQLPRPHQWANQVTQLKRIFSKRSALGPGERALVQIVQLADSRGGPGGCTQAEVIRAIAQLAVAIYSENAQTFDVGKVHVAE